MQTCARILISAILALAAVLAWTPEARAQNAIFWCTNGPAKHWLRLSWSANGSGDAVTGYNVYRGTVDGGPYTKLTATPLPLLFFRDDAVTPGTTYFYVLTAVNSGGESAVSTQITATP